MLPRFSYSAIFVFSMALLAEGCALKSNPIEELSKTDITSGRPTSKAPLLNQEDKIISWESDIRFHFESHCTRCHQASFPFGDWTNIESVRKNIDRIYKSISQNSMPKKGSNEQKGLGESERGQILADLQKWIDVSMPLDSEVFVAGADTSLSDSIAQVGPSDSSGPNIGDDPDVGGNPPVAPPDTSSGGDNSTPPTETPFDAQEIVQNQCNFCHQNTSGSYPSIDGQKNDYLKIEMNYFQKNERVGVLDGGYMQVVLANFSEKEISAISDYLSKQDHCRNKIDIAPIPGGTTIEKGREIYEQSCISCHGKNVDQNLSIGPRIFNQGADYLFSTLKSFVDPVRPRPSLTMKFILAGLSEQDLIDVANYLNQEKVCP